MPHNSEQKSLAETFKSGTNFLRCVLRCAPRLLDHYIPLKSSHYGVEKNSFHPLESKELDIAAQ
jgi:hypothetical protein